MNLTADPSTSNWQAGLNPERTHALVVGIERYDAREDWDLDGPADDAVRFTAWLLDRGVPANQVLLFLSPLRDDGPTRPELPPEVVVNPGQRQSVSDALTRTLPKLRGDLLWLFWGGHGVLTRDESRRLFYADASIENKRNLDLNSLLTALRSDLYAGLPRQIAVVDACQNHVERLMLANTLPTETFTYGQPSPLRDQFVLYAASPGQAAANQGRSRSGAFSAALMQESARVPIGTWPPDTDAIATRLNERFVNLLNTGKANQTPTTFRYRTWRGGEQVLGGIPIVGQTDNHRRRNPPSAASMSGLVDRLLDLESMADPVSRSAVVRQLRKGLAASVRYSPVDRVHVVNIVSRSLDWPGGLAEVMSKAKLYLDPSDPAIAAADAAAHQLALEVGEEYL